MFDALAAGEIDVYVDYSGTIWANQMQRSELKPRAELLEEVAGWLERQHGSRCSAAWASRTPMRWRCRGSARRRSASARSPISRATRRGWRLPAITNSSSGPEWTALRDAYGLAFRDQRQMQSAFMYPAVAAGDVDVISAYTSDGRIAQYDLVVLDDPKQAIPPYDAILLISPRKAGDRALIDALQPLIDAIDINLMREANLRAAKGASPDEVARWLWDEISRRKTAH